MALKMRRNDSFAVWAKFGEAEKLPFSQVLAPRQNCGRADPFENDDISFKN